MKLTDMTMEGFASELASDSPAPGGGSVAAYAGAQGFALISMVCRLTIGRKKYASVEEELKALLEVAEDKLERLSSLVDEDSEGFNEVMAALSLPKLTEEEKAKRTAEIEKATVYAAEIPLQTAKLCLEGLREIPRLLTIGNPNALSDMGVAALMLRSGLVGAVYNVQINAVGLKSEESKRDFFVVTESMLQEGLEIAEEIQKAILDYFQEQK